MLDDYQPKRKGRGKSLSHRIIKAMLLKNIDQNSQVTSFIRISDEEAKSFPPEMLVKEVTITPENVNEYKIEVFTNQKGWFVENIEPALLYAMGIKKGSQYTVKGRIEFQGGCKVLQLTSPAKDQGGWDILPFILVD